MSLQDIYKKAGVVMKPAAMKDGKLYSQQPHSGAGDFNFSRADGVQTRINKHGLIETVANNVPRLSYDLVDGKVSDCPHLLLEPQRTNLLLMSEQLDSGSWSKSGSTVEANQIVSPDGSQTADLITATSGNNVNVFQSLTTTNADYNYSVFLKKGNTNIIETYIFQLGVGFKTRATINFDNETATITNGSVFLEKHSDDWYRVLVTINLTSGGFTFGIFSDSTVGTRTVYAWGAMVEQGSYATSYIPTSGSIETRQADICNGSGNSETFNDSEGVLYAEIAAFDNNVDNARITINKASSGVSERVGFGFQVATNTIQAFVSRSSTQVNLLATVDITQFNKIAFKYKVNDFSLFIDGTKVGTDTLGDVPIGLDGLSFDDNDGVVFYGKVKELTVINEALTDQQLQLLTTP